MSHFPDVFLLAVMIGLGRATLLWTWAVPATVQALQRAQEENVLQQHSGLYMTPTEGDVIVEKIPGSFGVKPDKTGR